MTSRELMHRSEAAVSVELQTPDMTLNFGSSQRSTVSGFRTWSP